MTRALALVAMVVAAAPARAQDTAAVRTARITYLTTSAAYIDAGRDDGLRDGAQLQVVRGGAVVGVLKVAFLASHQASCDIVSESSPLAVGDSVRFRAAAPPAAPPVAAARTAQRRLPARAPLRGRIGTHYLVVAQSDGGAGGFSQPSLDVRMDGRPFGGGSVGVIVDVRARRTYSTLAGGGTTADGHTRAYQLALTWSPDRSPGRVTVGRQFVPGVPSVGMFDGLLVELNTPGWGAALFSGSQPDPLDFGFGTDVIEGGGYLQRRGKIGRDRQWAVTLGVTGSYQDAHANREFAFLQWSLAGPRLSAFLSQEIDYYRWWKRSAGMPAVSLTSTLATVRYRPTGALELHFGYDTRRNVLLYRDFVNPLTTFDDAFRQGAWAGMGVQIADRYRLALDARQSGGGTAGGASSYTVSAGAERPGSLPVGLRARSTYYRSRRANGWLHTGTVGFDPYERVHVDLSGGARVEQDPLADPVSRTITWLGTDVDANLGRAWYLMASGSLERGGPGTTNQVYLGVSLRF